jgi:hypothetical protein
MTPKRPWGVDTVWYHLPLDYYSYNYPYTISHTD